MTVGLGWFGPWDAAHYYGQSGISPATVDESLTLQVKVQRLMDIVERITARYERVLGVEKIIDAKLAATIENMRAQLAATAAELADLIETTNKAAIAFNPTTGTRHESIDSAISDMYDRVRVHALYCGQYDDLGLTCGEYEDLGLTCGEYDTISAKLMLGIEYNITAPAPAPEGP